MLADPKEVGMHESMQRLNVGFIGGGLNSAVGYTHFVAARLDGLFDVVAGCFSKQKAINESSAQRYGVAARRCYGSVPEMLSAEAGRLDAVCVLTPTPNHAEIVISALKAGFNVICEKALGTSVSEAEDISAAISESGRQLFVTFNYAGYPMVREARAAIRNGGIGTVQQVYCEMPSDGFARIETNPQDWRRQDYEIPCVSLDLGVHVHHIVDYLLGGSKCRILAVCEANFGRIPQVIDTVSVTGIYEDQVLAHLMWGKAALGSPNGLKFRVFGDAGSLEWCQSDPELLVAADKKGMKRVLERGQPNLHVANEMRYNRFKAGHPAGFVEAFANIYADFYASLVGLDSDAKENFGVCVATTGLDLLSRIHATATRCN